MLPEYEFMKDFIEKESTPTPAYVFDLDMLQAHVEKVKRCLGEHAQLCYAMKANPFLTGPMEGLIGKFEVCSPGEFRICERLGIPMEEIVLSGVYKASEDIAYVLETYQGKGVYTVESRRHLELLNEKAGENGLVITVLLRVTSGNQFGLDEQDIREIIRNRKAYKALDIVGLQFYSGTQKRQLSQMEKELHMLDDLLVELREDSGYEARELEYGPGFFVPYFRKDPETEVGETLEEFGKLLDGLHFKGRITLEMGRYLAAVCGYFVTSVVDQKINHGQAYALVDGGIHHLNYYGQTMAMKQPYATQLRPDGTVAQGEEKCWDLCGSLCTVSDVIVKRFPLKNAAIHDILVFERVGAYSVTEGIYLFLSRPLPRVYFWSREEGLRLVREDKHTDLLNSEK